LSPVNVGGWYFKPTDRVLHVFIFFNDELIADAPSVLFIYNEYAFYLSPVTGIKPVFIYRLCKIE